MNRTAGYVKLTQAIQWMAEGKQVEMKWDGGEWEKFPQDLTHAGASEVLQGNDEVEFRIKPRTVKLGSREVEAPVLNPVEGQKLWLLHNIPAQEKAARFCFDCTVDAHRDNVNRGGAFGSPDAARAAGEAISSLLRGES